MNISRAAKKTLGIVNNCIRDCKFERAVIIDNSGKVLFSESGFATGFRKAPIISFLEKHFKRGETDLLILRHNHPAGKEKVFSKGGPLSAEDMQAGFIFREMSAIEQGNGRVHIMEVPLNLSPGQRIEGMKLTKKHGIIFELKKETIGTFLKIFKGQQAYEKYITKQLRKIRKDIRQKIDKRIRFRTII